jgi:hypothetical protein
MATKIPKKKASKPWDWSPVDPLEVLVVTKDHKMFIGSEPITEIELKNLQQEVKALKSFRVWRILQETIRQKAIEKGLIQSVVWEETLAAKMMIHNLGIIKTIVEVLDTYRVPVIPKK